MSKKNIVIIACITIVCCFTMAMRKPEPTVLDKIRPYILVQIDSSILVLQKIANGQLSMPKLKEAYNTARKHYKHIEFFVEYVSPIEAKYNINGALVSKYDIDVSNEVINANGFQKIESILYAPKNLLPDKDQIALTVKDLSLALTRLRSYYSHIVIDAAVLAETMQIELYRIVALNLNGYDATINKTGIAESAACIMGLQQLLTAFLPQDGKAIAEYKIVQKLLQEAKNALVSSPDYDGFDRLNFIAKYINPLNQRIIIWHNKTGIGWSKKKQALNLQQPFLFSEAALNKNYFSIYFTDTLNHQLQAQLGKQLFNDQSFSSNKKISCASCHQENKAFADGLHTAMGFQQQVLERNTPTLLNVVYQKAFFADGRVYQLEQQSADVLHNKLEMGADINKMKELLQQNNSYCKLFKHAFMGSPDTTITDYSIFKAIAAYQQTLTTFNTRFDYYLQGKTSALTANEINGYNLFAGKALCGSCHFMPLFNGTTPPFFNESEFEIIGTSALPDNKNLDKDLGRYAITNADVHRYAFKTPTLRNISKTAPYMHNGVFKTLNEVIEFYHKGGGKGFGYEVPNQTLPFDSLQLNASEKLNIIAFLKTL